MISLKKLLAGVLSAAMVLGTMAIPAFADESTSGNAAKIGETEYATLQDAFNAAKKDDTITMLGNVTESIVIENGNTITLDLNGYTLTNTDGKHTIENRGTLTVTDSSTDKSGKVDNVSHAKIPLVNTDFGIAILNGGTFDRSLEDGNRKGNSCYTIQNHGTMTINDGVTVNNNGAYSSNIVNGYQSTNAATASTTTPTLTINGGNFSGGAAVVKNDEKGQLEINGGTFSQSSYLIHNWNKVTINNGVFNGSIAAILNTHESGNTNAIGELKINGGNFNGKIDSVYPGWDAYASKDISIFGGTFTQDVTEYTAANRTVMQNSDGTYTRKTGREVFIRNVCEYALANGMCPVLWDTGMGYSRSQCRMSNDIDRELFERLYKKAESGTAYVPDEIKNEYVWTGNIGASSWNAVAPVATDDDWNLPVSSVGAAYQISGIDWTKFTNPYLEIKINSLTAGSGGSVDYKVANKVNEDNQYYKYINASDAKASGTFKLSTGEMLKIDLSKDGLSGYDNIYIGMVDKGSNAVAFNANVTITIKDSSN